MVVNQLGISRDLIFHPGDTLKEMLENKHVSQKELALRTGVTQAFVANLINGKKDISASYAIKLEYALEVPASFFINLQARYDIEKALINDLESISKEEWDVMKKIKDSGLIILDEQKDEINLLRYYREMLHVSNLTLLKNAYPEGQFSLTNSSAPIDQDLLGAWIIKGLSQKQGLELKTIFKKDDIYEMIPRLQKAMFLETDEMLSELDSILMDYGIALSLLPKIDGVPVDGFISKRMDGLFTIIMSISDGDAIKFWYTLFHELGHIYNGELNRRSSLIDEETSAKNFAELFLIDAESYLDFVMMEDFSLEAIKRCASFIEVPPFIVIGALEEDGHIGRDDFKEYRVSYSFRL